MKRLLDKYNALPVQIKATVWFFVCSVLQRGISTITVPVFTRIMSTAEYGKFTVFNSWLSICQVIVTLQLTAGVYTMGIVKFREEEKVFTSSLQGLNLVLCLCWTAVYGIFHGFWNDLFDLDTVQMLAMLLMIWASSAFGFWMTTQRNQYCYRKLVAVTLMVSVLKPLVGVLMVIHAEDKVTARILGLAIVEVIAYSGFFVSQIIRGKKFYSGRFWRYAVLFNLPLIPHYLSGTVLSGADRIMIKEMAGEVEAGIYGLGYSVSFIMAMVNDSLNKTMSPWLYQRLRDKNYRDMPKVVYPSLVIVAAANLLLIAIAPEIVAIFAPVEYRDAVYIIPPVTMSVFVQYMYLCFVPFEFYFEKRIWTTIGTCTAAVANLILNYIFIRKFGYRAAGYTTLACYSINSLMHYYFMRKVCREYIEDLKPYSPAVLFLISGVFIAVGFAYIPTYNSPIIRYALTLMLLLVLFVQREKLMPVVERVLKRE